jgi:hypothetical protein
MKLLKLAEGKVAVTTGGNRGIGFHNKSMTGITFAKARQLKTINPAIE